MPDFLSLPRELRDDIYELVFRGSLTLKRAHLPRIRISKTKSSFEGVVKPQSGICQAADSSEGIQRALRESNDKRLLHADYYEGEEAIRYPSAEVQPPTCPLLCVNQQVRAEMQENIQKKGVSWRIRLVFRDDKYLLYPTWITIPAFSDRLDTLDVDIRIRKKKTASLFSTASSIASISNESETNNNNRDNGDFVLGSFALLQRLIERGPSFLSKKRGSESLPAPLNIGCVTVHLVPKDVEDPDNPAPKQFFDECTDWVDYLLTNKDDEDQPTILTERDDEWHQIDAFLHFFAKMIERFALEVEGLRREWVLNDAMVERDDINMRLRERHEREREALQERISPEPPAFICGTRYREDGSFE